GQSGILITGANSAANLVQGNIIGTSNIIGTVTTIGNTGSGVQVTGSAHDNTIGGDGPGQGNTIAYNKGGSGGVFLSGTNNFVLRSQRTSTYVATEVSNFQNGAQGISSPLVPAPTLVSVNATLTAFTITFNLNGLPAGTYIVQFFDNGGVSGPFGKSFLGDMS